MIVDREIAKLPEYMQVAWKTPPDQRTPGQKLTVTQIERTVTTADTTRKLVTEARHRRADAGGREGEARRRSRRRLRRSTSSGRGRCRRRSRSASAAACRSRRIFLHRGSPDSPGSQMTPGVLSVASETEWTFPEPPPDAKSSWRRRGFAEWLTSKEQSADRARDGQSPLAAPLRRGHRPHAEQLRQDGRAAVASGAARLARARVHRSRLEPEGDAQADARRRAPIRWRASTSRPTSPSIRRTGCSGARRACGSRPRSFATRSWPSSGALDRTLGGPSIFPYIDPDLFEESSRRTWRGKPDDDPSTWRRSIYVFLKRSIRYPMFETFDQPNLVNSDRSPQPDDDRAAGADPDEQRHGADAGDGSSPSG